VRISLDFCEWKHFARGAFSTLFQILLIPHSLLHRMVFRSPFSLLQRIATRRTMSTTSKPFGSWPSPITADLTLTATVGLSEIQIAPGGKVSRDYRELTVDGADSNHSC